MADASKNSGKNILSAASLTSEIANLAQGGDFQKAEKLRAYLLKHHPMALSEIIATGEAIEEQKTLGLDKEHLTIWEDLYSDLTKEETNALFYATKKTAIPSGKLLIKQGKPVSRLLFIDSGRVTLFHSKGEERILIGQMARGDILGDETFFQLSNPTFSAGAQSDLTLRFLDKAATTKWNEELPGLYQKIAAFAEKNNRSSQLIKRKKIEKRQYPRMKTERKIIAHILADDGSRSGESYRGTLIDFSQNGGCFGIHSSRPEVVQLLLGKRLELEFEVEEVGGESLSVLRAMIVKLGILLYNDYSVHIRLDHDISPNELKLIK